MVPLTVLSILLLCPLLISAGPIPEAHLPSQNEQMSQINGRHHERHSILRLIERIIEFIHHLHTDLPPCRSGIPAVHCDSRKVGKEQKAINMSKQSSNQNPGKNPKN